MSENIDFRVDYSKFKVMDEFNTDELKYPLILSIPHCGTVFPEEFLRAVRNDVMTLRKNEDILVYDLLEPAIRDGGIAAIKLNVSRSFIDVNRAKWDLDPNMFFDYPREDIGLNQQRSRYGLGLSIRLRQTASRYMRGESRTGKPKSGLKTCTTFTTGA